MSYVSSAISSQYQVKTPGNLKLLETLAIKVKTTNNVDILAVGINRPPNYRQF